MFQNLASPTVLLIPDLTGVTNSAALPITPPAVATPPFCGIAGVDHPSLVKVHNLVQPDLCRVLSPTLSHLYTARPSWWYTVCTGAQVQETCLLTLVCLDGDSRYHPSVPAQPDAEPQTAPFPAVTPLSDLLRHEKKQAQKLSPLSPSP